jgi:hypothetical protein
VINYYRASKAYAGHGNLAVLFISSSTLLFSPEGHSFSFLPPGLELSTPLRL